VSTSGEDALALRLVAERLVHVGGMGPLGGALRAMIEECAKRGKRLN
jgi:hypothetical protein